MVRKAIYDTKIIKSSRRKVNHSTNTDCRPWADLPGEMLEMISKPLNFIDYLAFGGVCSSWRVVSVAHREKNMVSQPPLLVIMSINAKRACSLYNIFNGERYKKVLPDLTGSICWGFSCGYLIMQDSNFKLWLINLLTEQELHFPILPECFRGSYMHYFSTILTYSTMLSDFVIVIAHGPNKVLHFCRPGDVNWTAYSYAGQPWQVMDLAVYDGKIYVVTNHARIGVFKLNPHPILTLLDVNGTPNLHCLNLQLLASNDRLLMVEHHCLIEDRIFRLDFTRMEWMKLDGLGEESLFLSEKKCSAVINPTKWRGCSNCVYLTIFNRCHVFPLDDKRDRSFPVVGANAAMGLERFFWYFPHQCYSKNLLHDDIPDNV